MKIRPLSGPSKNICWTTDSDPEAEKVVLLYAKDLEALELMIEGQEMLLTAYRIGARTPEGAFRKIDKARKVLDPITKDKS